MTPHPKPEKHRKRKKPGRLYGAKLKAQNEAIIIRDGDRCGVCRMPPPNGNHFAPHHNIYPQRLDIMEEKISVCPECHAKLQDNYIPELYHNTYHGCIFWRQVSKRDAQEWVRQRIKEIEKGAV